MVDRPTCLTPGDRVRLLRDSRGWSQQQLADMVGVSKTVILRFEKGQRRHDVALLNKLAAALEVDGFELLSGSTDPSHQHKARLALALALKMSDRTLSAWLDIGQRLIADEVP